MNDDPVFARVTREHLLGMARSKALGMARRMFRGDPMKLREAIKSAETPGDVDRIFAAWCEELPK